MSEPITVNLLSLQAARAALGKMLVRFRAGEHEPLIFGPDPVPGERRKPAAVIISIEDYRRFLRYEAEAQAREAELVQTVTSRVNGQETLPLDDIDAFAARIGIPPADGCDR